MYLFVDEFVDKCHPSKLVGYQSESTKITILFKSILIYNYYAVGNFSFENKLSRVDINLPFDLFFKIVCHCALKKYVLI